MKIPIEPLQTLLNDPTLKILSYRSCSGGSICQTYVVSLSNGQSIVLKVLDHSQDMFEAERDGLERIRQANVIRVPEVYGVLSLDDRRFGLAMEYISPGTSNTDFGFRFGQSLAHLHLATHNAKFGLDSNNFIGRNPQINLWSDDWPSFWTHYRVEPQLEMACHNNLATQEFRRLATRHCERLDAWIALPVEPACLLHGDLWSGNYLIDSNSQPVLIDPAIYYGRREAELAMVLLFGPFPKGFLEGYQDVWPLADGWIERVEIYQLYHLLNHLNLFGSPYYEQCLQILRKY